MGRALCSRRGSTPAPCLFSLSARQARPASCDSGTKTVPAGCDSGLRAMRALGDVLCSLAEFNNGH